MTAKLLLLCKRRLSQPRANWDRFSHSLNLFAIQHEHWTFWAAKIGGNQTIGGGSGSTDPSEPLGYGKV